MFEKKVIYPFAVPILSLISMIICVACNKPINDLLMISFIIGMLFTFMCGLECNKNKETGKKNLKMVKGEIIFIVGLYITMTIIEGELSLMLFFPFFCLATIDIIYLYKFESEK